MLERAYRSKNLIFKGVTNIGSQNPKEAVNEIINGKMDITPAIYPQQVNVLKTTAQNMMLLVKFGTDNDVYRVLQKTGKLSGTTIYIDRDMTKEERKNKVALIKIRRIILSKLSEPVDKAVKIKILTNGMRIQEHIFKWNGQRLICGKESANTILSQIFKYNFTNINFENLISDNNL